MTPEEMADDILKLVRLTPSKWPRFNTEIAKRISNAIREERECCAKIAENTIPQGHPTVYGQEIAAAIRNGGVRA
jgi:hypothetical protein